MTTVVMSQTETSSSPAASPPALPSPSPSPSPNPNHPPLPPLITSPTTRRSTLPRPVSQASKRLSQNRLSQNRLSQNRLSQNRLSQYSTGSVPTRSRPSSNVFPPSLPYAIVRDFAYPPSHPLHYGPPPEPSAPPSGATTPSSEQQRFSDPPTDWESRLSWETGAAWGGEGLGKGGELAPMHFGDGPPWSEDEDLQSPVVSSRHRSRHKSSSNAALKSRSGPRDEGTAQGGSESESGILNPSSFDQDRGFYVGSGGDGSERYYVSEGGEAGGPGGEYVTYPPDQARHSNKPFEGGDQQPRQYAEHDAGYRSGSDGSRSPVSPDFHGEDQSRYSRDYQFTITSPDEEMHGKAVALFDFERENENELPLVEGQIIWVSYRHGQGWLVAMDPKTQESGLVPEEYVRLLRDIEGGMTSLTGEPADGSGSPNEAGTPTQTEHQPHQSFGHTPSLSNTSNSNGYQQPVVSTFSTSSKDLDPYPQHLLGTQAGQAPPQVVHYHGQRGGSQANTPTLLSHQDVGMMRRGSQDVSHKKLESLSLGSASVAKTLPPLADVSMESAGTNDTSSGHRSDEVPPGR